jgi:ABC-type transporter Mla maintaining outer membrane lipid asymmetry permease subunit MlaE
MRKRLAVARALASSPKLLLCDEPTAGLDAAGSLAIARLLHEAHDQDPGRTTIVITHDREAFAGMADGVLVLERRTLRLLPPDRVAELAVASDQRRSTPGEGATVLGARRLLLQVTAAGETVWESVRRLVPVELGQVVRTVVRFALEPASFVALAGAVVGWLAMFFALRNNPVQGGFESALITGTGKVATAVIVPLLAGLFFTARMLAGAVARIGTMQRTNQVAALRMMGIRPADYLLTPLVWGAVIGMPVVTFVGVVAAAGASLFAAATVSGATEFGWAASYFERVDARDLLVVLAKATLSGYLIALCGYHLGTGPKRSGDEVGEAVNTATSS